MGYFIAAIVLIALVYADCRRINRHRRRQR
jgi:hypothetical protein